MIRKFKDSILVQISALGIFAIAFFHEVFIMQFWKDDSELLYSLQQNLTIHFPYQHEINLYIPIFKLFGTNPLGYYSYGLIFLFFSTIAFYFLLRKLFSNKTSAFLGSLIYLTSPVGIDTIFETNTFASTFFSLTLLLVILRLLLAYHEKRKLSYYFLAIVLFAAVLEGVSYRSFYFGGIIIFFEIIYLRKSLFPVLKKLSNIVFGKYLKIISTKKTININENEKNFILNFILRQSLLISIWVFILYVIPVYLLPDSLKYHPEKYSHILYGGIINYKLFLHPLLTIVNILFGGFAYIFYNYFYIHNFPIQIILLILTVLFCIYLFLWFKKKSENLLNAYLFSVGYLYITVLVLYPYSQREISISATRYLAIALPAYSILIACILFFLSTVFKNHKNKVLKLIPIFFFLLVIVVNSVTKELYIKDFNTRSYYAKQYATQLKKFIPNLPRNAFIYIKLDEDANVNFRLSDTHRGGIYDPRAYYAILYKMKIEDVNLPIKDKDYTVLLEEAKNNPVSTDKIFAFTYSANGLADITKSFRKSIGR